MENWSIIKPHLRAFKYRWLQWYAEQKSSRSSDRTATRSTPIAFIVGCGRSGTTILGQMFFHHPQVSYLFEPYHLWAAIDRRTDVLNLFHQVDACLLMNAEHYDQESYRRFNCLIGSTCRNSQAKIVLEKTPLNALRIDYLNAIAPGSKFVHIVRDGVEVCRSINKLASTNSYKIAGKPTLNQWWGVDDAKWNALVRDGTIAGYYTDEVHDLEHHLSRGAYEWLVSLGEIDRWRDTLGNRLKELTYEAFTTNPKVTLKDLCEFLEIDSPQFWIDKAISTIRSPHYNQGLTISLPPKMCQAFNSYQKRYGFPNRSVCLTEN